jgi:hypothetical protein
MVKTIGIAALPLAQRNPFSYVQQTKAARAIHLGCEKLRDVGGPVTRTSLAPRWITPTLVIAPSPKGACDVPGITDTRDEGDSS